MAYTSIHPISATLGKAVKYICNPKKTENGKFIFCFACHQESAEQEFEFTKVYQNSKVSNLGFHAVQSFKAGEVTPEQAQEIGIETMKRWLKDEYEFVLTTHTDKGHIHNHIIINSVNMCNGKSFSSQHDRKRFPAWSEMRKISDELLSERGLSVITNQKNMGKSYYENMQSCLGNSWKEKLKNQIDYTIKDSENFDDFLQKLRTKNITVRYEDYKKKSGKILAFKMPEQKYFVYAEKLGWYYEETQLKKRIERAVERKMERKNETKSEKYARRFMSNEKKIESLFDLSEERFNTYGGNRWARLQNLKIGFKTMNYLHEIGAESINDFAKKYVALEEKMLNIEEQIKDVQTRINYDKYRLKYLTIYRKFKPVNDGYEKAVFKDNYFRKHENELLLFKEAVAELKKTENSNKLPNVGKLKSEIQTLENQKSNLITEKNSLYHKLKEFEIVKDNINKLLSDEPDNNLEKIQQLREREQERDQKRRTINIEKNEHER